MASNQQECPWDREGYVEVKLNNKSHMVRAHIHTASAANYIDYKLFNKLWFTLPKSTDFSTISYTGTVNNYTDKCRVKITLSDGSKVKDVTCIIAKCSPHGLVLGHNFLWRFKKVTLVCQGPLPSIEARSDHDSSVVDITMNGKELKNAVLDTASPVSVIDRKVATDMGLIVDKNDAKGDSVTYIHTPYSREKCDECCVVQLGVGDCVYDKFKFIVAAYRLTKPVVFGRDFVGAHKSIIIDYSGHGAPVTLKFK